MSGITGHERTGSSGQAASGGRPSGMTSGWWSHRSPLSAVSVFSVGSALSVGSLFSFGSVLSIGSSGSILSIGSAGSILSIGSAGSILSIGGAGTILGIGGRSVARRNVTPAETTGQANGS